MRNIQRNATSAHGLSNQLTGSGARQMANNGAAPTSRSSAPYAQHSTHAHQPQSTRAQQPQSSHAHQENPAHAPHASMQAHGQAAGGHSRHDEELAILFRQMREITGVDLATLGAHLYTTPEVLCRFEAGEVDAFPPWAETVRIVTTMSKLVGIDSEPILGRISYYAHQPNVVSDQSNAVSGETAEHVTAPRKERVKKKPKLKLGGALRTIGFLFPSARTIGVAAIPFAMAFALILAPTFDPQNKLSGPLGNYAKAGWEILIWSSNSLRDGLRWVETRDPRSRKADKLKTNSTGN